MIVRRLGVVLPSAVGLAVAAVLASTRKDLVDAGYNDDGVIGFAPVVEN